MDLYQHHIARWPRHVAESAIRRRVQTVHLGNGIVLARVLGRLKMFLRSDDFGFGCHVMLDGFWEMWLTQFFTRMLRPGMTVVDIGANYGYYTLLFGDAVQGTGRVIAVEPNPAAVELLRRSVELNGHGHTEIVAQALDDKGGNALLYIPTGEPKNAALVNTRENGGGDTIDVSTTSFDELGARIGKIDLVKIDAEGAEDRIVRGMVSVIARHRPSIVLEYNAARYNDPESFLEILFRFYRPPMEIQPAGSVVSVDVPSLLRSKRDEDRLLFFAGAG